MIIKHKNMRLINKVMLLNIIKQDNHMKKINLEIYKLMIVIKKKQKEQKKVILQNIIIGEHKLLEMVDVQLY